MSMPGFVFHFRCDACDIRSDEYSLYVFGSLFHARAVFPAWSTTLKSWMSVSADLSAQHRSALEFDAEELRAVAASLSSATLTVCVPSFTRHPESGETVVIVQPEPVCPHCAQPCRACWGYPPSDPASDTTRCEPTPEEFKFAQVSMVSFSSRTERILKQLGIRRLGDLAAARPRIVAHPHGVAHVLKEVDRILAQAPRKE